MVLLVETCASLSPVRMHPVTRQQLSSSRVNSRPVKGTEWIVSNYQVFNPVCRIRFNFLMVNSIVVWLYSANLLCCASWRVGGGPAPCNTVCKFDLSSTSPSLDSGTLYIRFSSSMNYEFVVPPTRWNMWPAEHKNTTTVHTACEMSTVNRSPIFAWYALSGSHISVKAPCNFVHCPLLDRSSGPDTTWPSFNPPARIVMVL